PRPPPPPMDVVLVTHAPFDHLHRQSLRTIARQTRRETGSAPTLIVPHHVFDLVSDLGFKKIIEMEWWNKHREGALEITHVPSRHWGARVLKDSHRGYGGYVLRAGKHSVYHAGDTAYFNGFSEIGRRLSPELALLPIGAYNPPQFRNVHTSPADAMQAFLDLKSRWMVPMHYGTFRLSHEPIADRRLQSAAIPQRPYQSGGCYAGFSRPEIALDGSHALWDFQTLARADRRTVAVAGKRSQRGGSERQGSSTG